MGIGTVKQTMAMAAAGIIAVNTLDIHHHLRRTASSEIAEVAVPQMAEERADIPHMMRTKEAVAQAVEAVQGGIPRAPLGPPAVAVIPVAAAVEVLLPRAEVAVPAVVVAREDISADKFTRGCGSSLL